MSYFHSSELRLLCTHEHYRAHAALVCICLQSEVGFFFFFLTHSCIYSAYELLNKRHVLVFILNKQRKMVG